MFRIEITLKPGINVRTLIEAVNAILKQLKCTTVEIEFNPRVGTDIVEIQVVKNFHLLEEDILAARLEYGVQEVAEGIPIIEAGAEWEFYPA